MHLEGLIHVNVNCRDYDVSRAFYEKLGFELLLEVAPTNTTAVCRAVGFEDYRLRGGLFRLKGRGAPFVIDLLEWQSPRDDAPPYPALNHIGLARIALATSDFDADLAELRADGVEIIGDPAVVVWEDRPDSRFVCFKDPDGTVLELVENVTD